MSKYFIYSRILFNKRNLVNFSIVMQLNHMGSNKIQPLYRQLLSIYIALSCGLCVVHDKK